MQDRFRFVVAGMLPLLVATVVWAQGTLTDTIVSAPPDGVQQVLTQHRSELNSDVFEGLVKSAVQQAGSKHLVEAMRRARLADAVDAMVTGKPSRGRGETQLGGWLLRQSRPTDAEIVASDLLKTHPNSVRGQILMGRVYVAEKRGKDAVAQMLPVVQKAPQAAQAHLVLGRAYLLVGRKADARTEFQTAKSLVPSHDSAQTGAAAPAKDNEHFEKAQAAFKAGQYETAADEYGKALIDDPKDFQSAIYQGDAYGHLDKTDESIACYKRAVEINPQDVSAHRFLADAYESLFDDTKQKDYLDKALAEYQVAAGIDPSKAAKDVERIKEKESQVQ